MKSNVSYDADHRQQAKAERGVLVTFDFDGRYAPPGVDAGFRMTFQCVMTVEDAKAAVDEFQRRFAQRKKVPT